MKKKILQIQQIRSIIGHSKKHKSVLSSLGLKKIRDIVYKIDNSSIRGMIRKIFFLVKVKVQYNEI